MPHMIPSVPDPMTIPSSHSQPLARPDVACRQDPFLRRKCTSLPVELPIDPLPERALFAIMPASHPSHRSLLRKVTCIKDGFFFCDCPAFPGEALTRANNGSPEPRFTTDEDRLWFVAKWPIHKAFNRAKPLPDTGDATAQVAAVLKDAKSPCTRDELQVAAGIALREHFRKQYLLPLLEAGLIEMTIPDKPRSSKQQYRTTSAGRAVLESRNNNS
jgi:hypothetical protein